jgi:hypothetical protein
MPPATMATAPLSLVTCTGASDVPPKPPVPNWPTELSPQHHAVPSTRTAQVCSPPAATDTTLVRPETATGVVLKVVVPLPSSP